MPRHIPRHQPRSYLVSSSTPRNSVKPGSMPLELSCGLPPESAANLSTESPTSVMALELIAEEEDPAEGTGEEASDDEGGTASGDIFTGHSRDSLRSAQQHWRSIRSIRSVGGRKNEATPPPLGRGPSCGGSGGGAAGPGPGRPGLLVSEIEEEIRSVQAKTFSSKTSFRTAMHRLSTDLREANALVDALEGELERAAASRDERLERYEWARDRREHEVEAMAVERMHLEILAHSLRGEETRAMLEQTSIGQERHDRKRQQQERGVHVGQSPSLFRYRDETVQELRVMRNRLEGILELFHKAQKAKESTNMAMQAQAQAMKQDATSKYILYHKYRQI